MKRTPLTERLIEGPDMSELQKNHRRGVGRARQITPANAKAELREAVDETIALLDAGQAARRREDAAASGSRTSGRRRRCCSRSACRTTRSSRDGYTRYLRQGAVEVRRVRRGDFQAGGFRVVPPAAVRRGAYIAKNVVLMPSFVNIGAYVDEGTMVDTWATVGSCAQIGKNVHLSGGVGIGGVLEPLQANPTVIEDNCFIGARSEIVEGVIVGEGSRRLDGRLHRREHQDLPPRHRRNPLRPGPARLRRRFRVAALRGRPLQSVLRRHRQAGRRQHARQNEHQRAAARD